MRAPFFRAFRQIQQKNYHLNHRRNHEKNENGDFFYKASSLDVVDKNKLQENQ